MKSKWFQHLPFDRQDAFEATVRNSRTVLDRLYDIIEEEERSILAQERAVADFKPEWSYIQAARNGELRGLAKIKDLLKL